MRQLNTLISIALLLTALTPRLSAAQDTVVYVHGDSIHSVRVLTNASGQVLQQHDYAPFGEEPSPPLNVTNNRRFAGKERDTATGYDYFGGRYLAAAHGRFTTVDPVLDVGAAVSNPQRWNRYSYVSNNPQRYVDPDGRQQYLVRLAELAAAATRVGSSQAAQQIRNVSVELGLKILDFLARPATQEAIQTGLEFYTGSEAGPVRGLLTTGSEAFHHTMSSKVVLIEKYGLQAGSYATPVGGLTPVQAHRLLALPGKETRDTVFRIDLDAMRRDRVPLPSVTKVVADFGMPGGGYEMRFLKRVDPKYLRKIDE